MIPKREFGGHYPLLSEFARDQLGVVIVLVAMAIVLSYAQHGFLPGAERAFPIAGVKVPIWHLLWLGLWSGYTLALVGEAAGIFALPYSMSVLGFQSVAVSPTNLVITVINPYGALVGFWRENRWNLDLALYPSLGSLVGSQIGPFIRVFYLDNPISFKTLAGLGLLYLGGHLIYQVTPGYTARRRELQAFQEKYERQVRRKVEQDEPPAGLPERVEIVTVGRSWKRITIAFWGQHYHLSPVLLLLFGMGTGLVASTLGVGGGFLLTPLLVTVFHLPMYVVVAASIPFVIVQSIVGLFAYGVTLPWLTGASVAPEWGWALFVASFGVVGAWCAAKTQKFIPERYLKMMLGTVTAAGGLAYVLRYL